MRENFISFTNESLMPEEKICTPVRDNNSLFIGIPRERGSFEKRLPLTPESVGLLASEGHHIIIESGAGESIHYPDVAFSEAGAEITDCLSYVWGADIVLKVAPPTPQEVMMMKPRATLISLLQLSFLPNESIEVMQERKINAVAYELITDSHGFHPVISSISEIEGRTAVVIAAELLTNLNGGKGILLGGCAGVTPTEIVIIGAGRAGREAARTADALGATVKVFDNNVELLREVQRTLRQSIFTSNLHPNVLRNSLHSADVVIGTLRFENGERRFRVSEELIRSMKKGALLIDLSVDQGGCFETSVSPNTLSEAIFEKYGVTHFCVPNISSRVARTTSICLSNHFTPLLLRLAEFPSVADYIRHQECFRYGVYVYNGKIVNKVVGEHFSLPWSDIALFLTTFQ
ncbi:MAG: alanine dehydrogenase [Bacteroidales bacterium]